MNSEKLISKRKKIVLVLLALSLVIALAFYLRQPETLVNLKDLYTKGKESALLNRISHEISNSGKLISEANFPSSNLTKIGVLVGTNAERTKFGLKPLASDSGLDRVATIRMRDMFVKQYFEHVSPSGDSASKEADVVGYEYITLGENIALGNFKDDDALVLAWMNSPGHRANILNSKYTEIGISVGKGMYEGRETWIAVQIFGKPLSDCPAIDQKIKTDIDADQARVEQLQIILDEKKGELNRMKQDSSTSRKEYNQKVDEYNALVNETNALLNRLKADVVIYNQQIKAFNSCL